MIQKVYGEFAVHCVTMFHQYNVFSEGRESIRDEQRSRRLTTTRTCKNIARMADILKEDHGLHLDSQQNRLDIPKTIVQQILREDLQKWKLHARFVPYELTAEQKEQCLNHTYNLIEMIKNGPNFLDFIITGDMIREQSAKVPNSAVRTSCPPKNFDFKNQG